MSSPKDWIVDETPEGFQFDPIRPARYAESTLLIQTPKIIIVSATLRPKTLYMLGIGKMYFDFFEFESDFDPKRCPIYWVPTMRVDARAKDLSMLWMRLDQIASRRRDRKGIIHTISYARQQDILARSRFSESMYTNVRGTPATQMVEVFKQSKPGTILVSPSVATGYDFPGKDCEWQFICKIPFPDGRTRINRARNEDDKEYGAYQAMQSMVQSFGRGMRSKVDQCEGFICDDHLQWFLPRFRHLAPNSFYRLFKKVDILPQPPERLL
jgi:Rad3-related DNA helicase